MYCKKMIGLKCYLSPLDIEDASIFTQWVNDYDVTRHLTLAPMSISEPVEREVLEKLSRGHHYAVVDLKNDRLLGICGFLSVDHLNQTGEVGLFIGAKNLWGQGYGAEALSLLVDYGFRVLNLHNVMLQVRSYNERAIRCYEKIGFVRFGTRTGAILREGKRHDMIYMELTADRWTLLGAEGAPTI